MTKEEIEKKIYDAVDNRPRTQKERNIKSYEKNINKNLDYARQWRNENREKVREMSRKSKAKIRRENLNYVRKINRERCLLYKFGITSEEYNILFTKQNGLCKICNQPEKAIRNGVIKALAVDHCHKSNKIRGLLCQDCNTMLGKGKDSIIILESAIKYLKES